MELQLSENETKGSFYAIEDNVRIGEMTFSKAGTDRIIIDHTEVSEDWKGFGVGDAMVREAVRVARERKISIIPLCVFARSVFEKNPELRDVL